MRHLRTVQLRRAAPVDRRDDRGDDRARSRIAGRTTRAIYFAGALGLGFRRLSIIDLAGGHQPMSDAERDRLGGLQRRDLQLPGAARASSKALGHVFRTRSDTEVIVHGYKQWGTDVLDRLNGMFGLAIWDVTRAAPASSRATPLGIKLVYYRVDDGTRHVRLGAAGRPRRAAGSGPTVDTTGAATCSCAIATRRRRCTLYEGIRKLAPGTMAVFEDGRLRVERWYSIAPAAAGALA